MSESSDFTRQVEGEHVRWLVEKTEQDDDGRACGTRLYANPWVDVVQCRGCGTRWDRQHWLWLGSVLRDVRDTEDEHGGAA